MLAAPTTAYGADLTIDPQSAEPSISTLWSRTDGTTAQRNGDRAWLWGPAIRAITREPYRESPGGSRQVFYFDKARLEITNPQADPGSPWYATEGMLVREMITGQIQVGDHTFVDRDPAAVPVTGDLQNNPLSPSYATLAAVASVGTDANRRSPSGLGQPVTALLQADGTVVPAAVPASDVTIAAYDDHLGHNLPNVFVQWLSNQPYPPDYLVGYPLTEPYWVDTFVGGAQRRVLMQAFERRVLTYTPSNPDGWKVESGNVGLHYRIWRGLRQPDDPQLVPLASSVPYGEIIVDKAVSAGIDPFLFAALAKVTSSFDPLAQMPNSGRGLIGVRPALMGQSPPARPFDPTVNAGLAASALAGFRALSTDWRAVLALYYTGGANPDWSDASLNAFVSGVLNTQAQMLSDFDPPPATLQVNDPPLRLVGGGRAAFYAPGYSVAWWVYTLQRQASWGNAVANWSPDPNGYYCVNPDFRPGQRLQLTANGVTLWCTIGDAVSTWDQASWRARWVVELSYNTFQALRLNQNNWVEVRAP